MGFTIRVLILVPKGFQNEIRLVLDEQKSDEKYTCPCKKLYIVFVIGLTLFEMMNIKDARTVWQATL